MNETQEYLVKANTYYLATVDGDKPRVRPFGTANIFDGKLYIQTGKSKDVAKQIAKNPHVEISACQGETWLRLTGTLVLDDRIEPQEAMLEAYPELKSMYKPGDGETAAYYFKDATAAFYSFGGEARTVSF